MTMHDTHGPVWPILIAAVLYGMPALTLAAALAWWLWRRSGAGVTMKRGR